MLLKEKAIQSFNMWASVGKSRNETVFDNMRRDKANYKRAISGIKKKVVPMSSLIALYDALLNKDMNRFWQSWRSKFGSKHPAVVVCKRYC